jgi:hypothetical protein
MAKFDHQQSMSKTAKSFLQHQEMQNAKYLLENQKQIKGISKQYLNENQKYGSP